MKKSLLKIRGFTLIELLVVIAIIAILTAIVTSNFTSAKAKARDGERVSDLAQIQLALSLYIDRCNVYPGQLATNAQGAGCTATLGDYISVIPKDPGPGNPVYTYKTNATVQNGQRATNYVLKASLEQANPSVQTDAIKTAPGDIVSPPTCNGTLDYCVSPN